MLSTTVYITSSYKMFLNLQKLYKLLSEVKLEVETVIKTGRQIVQKQQTENPKAMDEQLTALKLLYNDLGAQVGTGNFRGLQVIQDIYKMAILSCLPGNRREAGLGKSFDSFSKVPEGEYHVAGLADHQRSSAAAEEQLRRYASGHRCRNCVD